MTPQYLAKFFLSQNAFCDHDANLTAQVTDDMLTFAGDPMDADAFVFSVKWKLSEEGFTFAVADTLNCIPFGPEGERKAGDVFAWSPGTFDGDKIRFTLKLA